MVLKQMLMRNKDVNNFRILAVCIVSAETEDI